MENLELKVCPFCGQAAMCEHGDDIRVLCECDGAAKYRESEWRYEKRAAALEELCGSECGKADEAFEPVSEEVHEILKNVVRGVSFRYVDRASVTLSDGSVVKITKDGVERTVKVAVKK